LRSRLFQTGHYVEKMTRVGIGNLELGLLARGSHRELSAAEVSGLSRAIDESASGRVPSLPKKTQGVFDSTRPKPASTKSKWKKPLRAKPGATDPRGASPEKKYPGKARPAKGKPFLRERKDPRRTR
jgi:hypothetical protein